MSFQLAESEFHYSIEGSSISARLLENTVELVAIYVPETNRHQGIGKQLFNVLLSSIPLEVSRIELISIPDAEEFWKKLGFSLKYLWRVS